MKIKINSALFLLLVLTACITAPNHSQTPESGSVDFVTDDGVRVYGEIYNAGLQKNAPLILLFHQGGSNGRGEYAPLVAWLNGLGFRLIAWDQRAGGETYGDSNRTKAGLTSPEAVSYCDAYLDLQGALDYVVDNELATEVVVWGSSYSAALVVRLASGNPGRVTKVLAASPASGGPMADCRAAKYIDGVRAPVLVLRPASEMQRDSSKQQRAVLERAGAEFLVLEHGVHGSSMLVDLRTEHDMTQARSAVAAWLNK